MADTEVENTLREIRERVRAESRAVVSAPVGVAAADAPSADGSHVSRVSDALARLEANLATAERAWSRLPPLLSNRTGWVARLELWVKRQIKRATHWYTWEQVNFNSAAFHALRDAHAALDASRQELSRLASSLASSLAAEAAERRADAASLKRVLAELESRVARTESLRAEHDALRAQYETLHAGHGVLRAEHEALRTEHEALRVEHATTHAERKAEQDALRTEMRERVGHALEEQRVSFKQLSLEASERAVMQDRARRAIEERLGEISKAVNRES